VRILTLLCVFTGVVPPAGLDSAGLHAVMRLLAVASSDLAAQPGKKKNRRPVVMMDGDAGLAWVYPAHVNESSVHHALKFHSSIEANSVVAVSMYNGGMQHCSPGYCIVLGLDELPECVKDAHIFLVEKTDGRLMLRRVRKSNAEKPRTAQLQRDVPSLGKIAFRENKGKRCWWCISAYCKLRC
jgi:hypothetical protein